MKIWQKNKSRGVKMDMRLVMVIRSTLGKKCSEYFEKSILPDLNTLASYEIKKYVSYLFNDLTGLTTNPI